MGLGGGMEASELNQGDFRVNQSLLVHSVELLKATAKVASETLSNQG